MLFTCVVDIIFDMYKRRAIPSLSALLAFECAARHGNFRKAADELHTSQSAISRHIANLESRLGVRLFDRRARSVELSSEGELYYRGVVTSLDGLESAAEAVARAAQTAILTIACSHEISHLLVMPRFESLQTLIGSEAKVRVITYNYDDPPGVLEHRADIVFTYHPVKESTHDKVVVYDEAVAPVCSPSFYRSNRKKLSKPPLYWLELPFLEMTKENLGWATWSDWLAHAGVQDYPSTVAGFDNYVYLLEAAAAGRELALGWRSLIERYVESQALMSLDDYVEFDHQLYAVLTTQGREHPLGPQVLSFFRGTTPSGPPPKSGP